MAIFSVFHFYSQGFETVMTVTLRHHIDDTEFYASVSVTQHTGDSELIIGNLKTVLYCNLQHVDAKIHVGSYFVKFLTVVFIRPTER